MSKKYTKGMSKKELVRTWCKNAEDGFTFTENALAERLGVTSKDINNVMKEVLAGGGVSRKRDNASHSYDYTVDSNAVALFFTRFPNGVFRPVGSLEENKKVTPLKGVYNPPRRSPNRSPLAIAIDGEIKELEGKIAKLRMMRKEFI